MKHCVFGYQSRLLATLNYVSSTLCFRTGLANLAALMPQVT